ncbi:hypothetical protein ANANG_G00100560, partial [Anguilla anguilla]
MSSGKGDPRQWPPSPSTSCLLSGPSSTWPSTFFLHISSASFTSSGISGARREAATPLSSSFSQVRATTLSITSC